MLNISHNSVSDDVRLSDFQSFRLLRRSRIRSITIILGSALLLLLLICLFLPWTQNINAKGYVTTRSPEQRPQAIQAVIAGRVEKWFVREGDFVEKGDTIVHLTEIKSEYFDPELVSRTAEQVDAKSQSIASYDGKISALNTQAEALQQGLVLKRSQIENKLLQARNKIQIDSIDLVALRTNLEIAANQFQRTKELYDRGLKTLTELQEKELKQQQAAAKVNVQENKLANQRNELLNLTIELSAADREYADKIAKSRSDRQSALADKLESMAATSKLQNMLSNYQVRQQFYYLTAPQSGFLTKTLKKGIGETLKEGSDIATIVPADYDLAAEVYINPQDLPLLGLGKRVNLRFDGWPAIVISGWPETSTGVFPGTVVAIDQVIGDNGKYRILVGPNDAEKDWPESLRVGAGVRAFILLNDVPIWYEIWRQLNGFPADFYQQAEDDGAEVKRKAPIKSVK